MLFIIENTPVTLEANIDLNGCVISGIEMDAFKTILKCVTPKNKKLTIVFGKVNINWQNTIGSLIIKNSKLGPTIQLSEKKKGNKK